MIQNIEIIPSDSATIYILELKYIFYTFLSHHHFPEFAMDKEEAKSSEATANSFVIVQPSHNSDSDHSFEELQPEHAPFTAVEMVEREVTNDEDNEAEQDTETSDANDESCNDNIRHVLDDVESQIENIRDAVMKLVKEKENVVSLLDNIQQSLPDTPELSSVEREELSLEVARLQGRLEDVRLGVEVRRTDSQQSALAMVEEELLKLVKMVQQVSIEYFID